MIKKRVMELMWRVQASQTVIGLVFWPLTLTGIFYPYVRERFDNFGLGQANVFFGMLLLFLLMVALVLVIGLIFDKMRFWKEQAIVNVERNPYMSYKLSAKEVYWLMIWTTTARAGGDLAPELRKKIDFFEKWMERSVADDAKLKSEVQSLRRWVEGKG